MNKQPVQISEASSKAATNAVRDFIDGPKNWRVWLLLGLYDIQIRYKRTFLGPLWITIGTGATFTMMAMIFSAVLKTDINEFLPYLGAGMILWSLISGVVNDGPQVFVQARHLIDSMRMPMTTHVLRCVCRNVLIFAHNFLVFLVICAVVGLWPSVQTLYIFLTFPLFLLPLYFGALILSMLGARFRDISQMASVCLQMLFFMTPILWRVEDMPLGRKYWVTGSPLYHMIEIVRAPLLGYAPNPVSVLVTVAFSLVLMLVSLALFRVLRRKISYWL